MYCGVFVPLYPGSLQTLSYKQEDPNVWTIWNVIGTEGSMLLHNGGSCNDGTTQHCMVHHNGALLSKPCFPTAPWKIYNFKTVTLYWAKWFVAIVTKAQNGFKLLFSKSKLAVYNAYKYCFRCCIFTINVWNVREHSIPNVVARWTGSKGVVGLRGKSFHGQHLGEYVKSSMFYRYYHHCNIY